MNPLLALVILSIAATHNAVGKPSALQIPPMGDPITVDVWRGGSHEITLKAVEGLGNPLKYESLSDPRHGKLVNFRQADPNRQGSARITYIHGDDEESTADEFTFRARAEGGGVSSPIKVNIRILDSPPRMSAPARVDFATVFGEEEIRTIGITNSGGSVLQGKLDLQPPFHLENSGYFRLRRGQSTNITIRFSPKHSGTPPTQTSKPTKEDPEATIVLAAHARAPFAAHSTAIEVKNNGAREGLVSITNFLSYALELALSVHPENTVELSSATTVPPKGEATIPVRIGRDRVSGKKTLLIRVRSEAPPYGRELTVEAPAVPPKLELLTTEVDLRSDDESLIEVRNSGGTEGRFTLKLPAVLRSLEKAETFAVSPGETIRVRLQRKRGISTEGTPEVIVDLARMEKVPVLLPADAPPPPLSAPPKSQPSIPVPTPAPVPRNMLSETPVWTLGRIAEGKDITLTIGLTGDDPATDYRIEQVTGINAFDGKRPLAGLTYATRELPVSMACVVRSGKAASKDRELRTVTLLFKGLPPGEAVICRVVPLSDGAAGKPTAPFLVAGPAPLSIPWNSLLGLLGGTLILWLVWMRIRARKA